MNSDLTVEFYILSRLPETFLVALIEHKIFELQVNVGPAIPNSVLRSREIR